MPETRTMAFDSLKMNFGRLMSGHPKFFGFDLGARLPRVATGFCDTRSRSEFVAFFQPKVGDYEGTLLSYEQTLEQIDLCIALKEAQQPSIAAFLQKY